MLMKVFASCLLGFVISKYLFVMVGLSMTKQADFIGILICLYTGLIVIMTIRFRHLWLHHVEPSVDE